MATDKTSTSYRVGRIVGGALIGALATWWEGT